ncbi:MAG: hypothetical protein GF320_02760 [Armatimonadia bacterium]|nr:hypothetical protein [Armatimonadia bacterium]
MAAIPTAICGLCVAVIAPGGPMILLTGDQSAATMPTTVTYEPADLAAASSLDTESLADPAVVTEAGERVPSQTLTRPDDTTTVVFLPPHGAGRLRLVPREAVDRIPSPPEPLEVEESGDTITVTSAHYRITHPKSANGGLPTVIELANTGKRLDDFVVNDRVHSPEHGGHLLRDDPEGTARLVAAGPLMATVETRARYGGGDAPGSPEAVYRFHYFATTPAVLVEATMSQSPAIDWPELHLLEINEQGAAFGEWAVGRLDNAGALEGEGATHQGARWGALKDGANVLGIAYRGQVRVHDGRGGYGTYVHGPWVSWAGQEAQLSAILWVSAGEGSLESLARAGEALGRAPQAVLTTALIQDLEDQLGAAGPEGAMAVSTIGRLAADSFGERAHMLRRARALQAEGADPRTAALEGGAGRLLASEELALIVSRTGQGVALSSLFDPAEGREMTSRAQPLWNATLRLASGEELEIASDEGFARSSASVAGQTARLQWSGHEVEGLEARMRLRLTGPRLTSQLEVDVPPEVALVSVTPLDLHLGALGDASDDAFVYPMVSGGLVEDPLGKGVRHAGRYPSGWTPLPLAAYYDPDGGLYVAWHDAVASTKEILTETTGDQARIRMTYPAQNAGVPGKGFRQPGEVVIELMRGDWYDVARTYRAWAQAEADWWPNDAERRTPEWMEEIAVWAQTSGGPEEVVGPVKEFAEYMGVPTAVHWYNWHQIPFDVEYPHYFPTKPGVREGVAELQAAGVRVMPYINGRLWDTALDDFQSEGIHAATKDEEGNPYIEEYGSGAKLAPMCPTQDLWQDTVREIVLRLCGEVGVDGVYIDQVAAAQPRLCYDASHGHPLAGGAWWNTRGYWPMLTELRQRLRELPGEKMITTECNAEPYSHLFDGYLTWHFQYHNQIPLFAAIYGGRVQLFGRAFGGDSMARRLKAAEALVWGEQLGWAPPSIIDDPLAGPMLRRCARMRHALQPFLAVGDMAHPPRVTGQIPRVTSDWQWHGEWVREDSVLQHGAWRDGEGRLVVIFANVSEEPLSFTWEWDGTYLSPTGDSVIMTEDGEGPGPALETPGRLRINLESLEVRAYRVSEAE